MTDHRAGKAYRDGYMAGFAGRRDDHQKNRDYRRGHRHGRKDDREGKTNCVEIFFEQIYPHHRYGTLTKSQVRNEEWNAMRRLARRTKYYVQRFDTGVALRAFQIVWREEVR